MTTIVGVKTRGQGKPPKQRAGRDDGVKANVRPKGIGRPPAASSIKRYYDGDKLRPKPLGKKLLLQSALKPESLVKSSAPHLLGSLLRQVRKGGRERGFHYFLDPNSPAAILGYSTTARRTKTGRAKESNIRTKEEKSYAVTQAVHLCCARPKCGAKFGGVNPRSGKRYTIGHFVIDHPTDKVSSWTTERKIGSSDAQLKAGTAQFLCLFCNEDKSARDRVNFAPLK